MELQVNTIDPGPSAYPQIAVVLIGKGVDPVIGQPMHREISFPVAIPVTRGTAGIGAEPLVTVLVDPDRKHVFIGQSVIAGKGVPDIVCGKVYFKHAD